MFYILTKNGPILGSATLRQEDAAKRSRSMRGNDSIGGTVKINRIALHLVNRIAF